MASMECELKKKKIFQEVTIRMSCCMLYRTFHLKAYPMAVCNYAPAGGSVPAWMTSWLACFSMDSKCWVFKDKKTNGRNLQCEREFTFWLCSCSFVGVLVMLVFFFKRNTHTKETKKCVGPPHHIVTRLFLTSESLCTSGGWLRRAQDSQSARD